jgi:hypothetical protein
VTRKPSHAEKADIVAGAIVCVVAEKAVHVAEQAVSAALRRPARG